MFVNSSVKSNINSFCRNISSIIIVDPIDLQIKSRYLNDLLDHYCKKLMRSQLSKKVQVGKTLLPEKLTSNLILSHFLSAISLLEGKSLRKTKLIFDTLQRNSGSVIKAKTINILYLQNCTFLFYRSHGLYTQLYSLSKSRSNFRPGFI